MNGPQPALDRQFPMRSRLEVVAINNHQWVTDSYWAASKQCQIGARLLAWTKTMTDRGFYINDNGLNPVDVNPNTKRGLLWTLAAERHPVVDFRLSDLTAAIVKDSPEMALFEAEANNGLCAYGNYAVYEGFASYDACELFVASLKHDQWRVGPSLIGTVNGQDAFIVAGFSSKNIDLLRAAAK
jgi:hypothetical protein